LDTLGLENDLSMPSSTSRLSSMATLDRFAEAFGYGVAVVGTEGQRLAPTLADPLPQTDPAEEISGDLCILPLGHIPGHHFAAPDVDNQVKVSPHATDAGGQVGDVPTPHLIGASGLESWHGAGFMGRPCPTTTVSLPVGMDHPIKAALRADDNPRLTSTGTICPGDSAANSCWLQVSRIRWRSSSLRR